MATVKLYPSSDSDLGHSCSTGSTGYTLINEVTADGDSSYIYDRVAKNTTEQVKTSTFNVNQTSVTRKFRLNSLSYVLNCKSQNSALSSTLSVSCSVNGGSFSTVKTSNATTSYQEYTNTLLSNINTDFDNFTEAGIQVRVQTSSTNSSSGISGTDYEIRVTQLNLTANIDYYYNCAAFAKSGTGISNVSVSSNEVIEGDTTTFTATVENNAVFDGWYSDEQCTNKVSSSTTYTATVNSDLTLYAKGFMIYTVSAQADENSTVSISPSSGPYKQGDTITVTATPSSSRYSFVAWYSNPERTTVVSQDNPYSFTLNANTALYAKTKLNEAMYVKVNGTWELCTKGYRKENGVWIEQTVFNGLFDTTKNYIKIEN